MSYTFDANIVSDLFKDVNGFRPGSTFYTAWNSGNNDQKQVIWDNLILQLEEKYTEDKKAEAEAIKNFEAKVTLHMELGASSRETALRWIVDAMELSDNDKLYGGGYICYALDLPYSYEKEFNAILEEETV
jgi:hypothetical protein